MRSLSIVSYRSLLARKARYALTALGVTFGIAVLFGVLVTSGTTRRALDDTVHGSAGSADAIVGPVGAFDSVLPAGVDAKVAKLPGVQRVTTSLVIRSLLAKAPDPNRPAPAVENTRTNIVFVNGVDAAYPQLHTVTVAAGRLFTPGAGEAVIPQGLAKRLHIQVGQAVQTASASGFNQLTVVGLLRDTGAALSSNGAVVYTSLPTLQREFGKGAVINGVDVDLAPGTDAGRWVATNRAALGDGVAVQEASSLEAGFRSFVAGINSALGLVSIIALFVGAFLIFLTFSLSVAERTRMYATLRALGAVPRQVRRVVVREAAMLGLASSVAGILLGYVLALGGVRLIGSLLRLNLPSVGFPIVAALVSITIGTVVSALAAWAPARRAARLDPVAAMRDGLPAAEDRGRLWVRIAVIASGFLLTVTTPSSSLRSLGVVLVLLGAILIVPFLLRPLARVLGMATKRLAPGVGDIAVMHLVKERSRSAYTLALIMVVLAMIFSVAASNLAMTHTLDAVLTRQQGGDMQVVAPGAFEPGVGDQIAAVPGVDRTTPVRFGQTDLQLDAPGGANATSAASTTRMSLTVIDPASYFHIAGFSWVEGDDASAVKALTSGGAVLLPDTLAESLGRHRGGQVVMRTNQGLKPFTIAGTYAQLGGGFGAVVSTIDNPLFGAGRPNLFLASVKQGADPQVVRASILRTVHVPMFIDTAQMVRAQAHAQLQGFFSLAYAMLFLAAATGMLGLANTLVFSVLLRRREIGILRSAGAVGRQIRGMVLVEAMTLAVVAFVLAVPLGSLLAAGLVAGQRRALGFSVHFSFPWGLLPTVGVIALVLAAIATVLPARRAGRLEVVSALRFD